MPYGCTLKVRVGNNIHKIGRVGQKKNAWYLCVSEQVLPEAPCSADAVPHLLPITLAVLLLQVAIKLVHHQAQGVIRVQLGTSAHDALKLVFLNLRNKLCSLHMQDTCLAWTDLTECHLSTSTAKSCMMDKQ